MYKTKFSSTRPSKRRSTELEMQAPSVMWPDCAELFKRKSVDRKLTSHWVQGFCHRQVNYFQGSSTLKHQMSSLYCPEIFFPKSNTQQI